MEEVSRTSYPSVHRRRTPRIFIYASHFHLALNAATRANTGLEQAPSSAPLGPEPGEPYGSARHAKNMNIACLIVALQPCDTKGVGGCTC